MGSGVKKPRLSRGCAAALPLILAVALGGHELPREVVRHPARRRP